MDTVIIGNGVIATSLAFRLSQRSVANDHITLIGKRARPGSATLAAAAMMNCFAEVEAGGLDTDLDKYRFEISRAAAQIWPKFEQELVRACEDTDGTIEGGRLHHAGTFVINNSSADDLDDANFDAIVSALREYHEDFAFVDPSDIPNYRPEQRYRSLRAIHIPNEGWLNPRRLMELFDRVLQNHPHVTIVDDSVASITATGGEISSVTTETGHTFVGDKFVLASGATVTDLLAASGLDLGVQRIFYGIGVSIEISSQKHRHVECVRTPNRGLACGLYTVPYLYGSESKNDHILIGASNFISPTPHLYGRLTSVEGLMRGAIEQVNCDLYNADLVRVNVGWRPTSQDTFPLIGCTEIPNLIIATGTKRDGLHLSPLLSDKIAALVYDEPLEEKFSWFAPGRKPLRPLSREQAISKTVRHQVNAAYQHGFVPSHGQMRAQLEATFRDSLERLHDQVGAVDWGIPPEMIEMYRYGHAFL